MILGTNILVVDDQRTMFDIWQILHMSEPEAGSVTIRVTFARNYQDACECLSQNEYDVVFMDHDLGCYDESGELTGYDILCGIESGDLKKPLSIKLTTMNASVRLKMQQAIDSIYRKKE